MMPMMPRRPSLTVLAPLACLLVPGAPLAAQHYQCSVPRSVNVPRVTPDAPPRPMPVTGYTLALSWSPEFCKPRRGQPRHARQPRVMLEMARRLLKPYAVLPDWVGEVTTKLFGCASDVRRIRCRARIASSTSVGGLDLSPRSRA